MVRSTLRWWWWLTLFWLFAVGSGFTASHPQQPGVPITGKVRRSIAKMTTIKQDGALSVELTALSDGAPILGQNLDLGNVSYGSSAVSGVQIDRARSSFTVRTAFGILVRDSSRNFPFASISGYVPGGSDRMICRIDNKPLTGVPAVIAPHAVVGNISRHTLAIEVPTSLTEREMRPAIVVQFIVVPN